MFCVAYWFPLLLCSENLPNQFQSYLHSCMINVCEAFIHCSLAVSSSCMSSLKNIWISTLKYGSKPTMIQETSNGTMSNSHHIHLCRRLCDLAWQIAANRSIVLLFSITIISTRNANIQVETIKKESCYYACRYTYKHNRYNCMGTYVSCICIRVISRDDGCVISKLQEERVPSRDAVRNRSGITLSL